jgi:hypothetical protein
MQNHYTIEKIWPKLLPFFAKEEHIYGSKTENSTEPSPQSHRQQYKISLEDPLAKVSSSTSHLPNLFPTISIFFGI